MPTLCAVENPHVTYSWPSVHMWSLCIRGSTSKDSADHGLCGTVVFIVEKNLRIHGPVQFQFLLLEVKTGV